MTAIRNIESADTQVQEELEWTVGQLRETLPGLRFQVDIQPLEATLTPQDVLMAMLSGRDPLAEGTMAVTDMSDGTVTLLTEWAADHQHWQDGVRKGIELGNLHPRVNSARPAEYSLVHEVGHVFHTAALGPFYASTEGDEVDFRYRKAVAIAWEAVGDAPSGMPLDRVPTEFGMRATFGIGGNLEHDLSRYAALGGPNELCAEAFVTHLLHPGQSKAADAVYEYMLLEYTLRQDDIAA